MFEGVLNRAFTALPAYVKYIHYVWGKTSSGKSDKIWLGDENFTQRKSFPGEIFPNKFYLTFMKVLNIFAPTRQKALLPTSFSAVTPTNVGIRPQNLLTFSVNLFTTVV